MFKALRNFTEEQALAQGKALFLDNQALSALADERQILAEDSFERCIVIRAQMEKWCKENLKCLFRVNYPELVSIEIRFSDPREAMRFKLTWGGVEL